MGMSRGSVFTTSLCLAAALLLLTSGGGGCIPAAAAAEAPMEACMTPVTVEVACRTASDTHAGVEYEYCVAALVSDRRSREAGNMHGLAMLATKLAIDHAASTEAKIDDLGELEESPQHRARFDHCLEQYGGAADLLRDALDNLQAHIYGKAMEQLAAALGASESCEDAWKGQERLPVAGHDREYGRMAHIALGFTHHAAASA
ncbi:hypothetical protein ACP4OV_021718 [Aristida adscensionis]